MRVLLPEGSGLVEQSNLTTPVVQPEDGEQGSLGGRRFYVEWKRNPSLDTNLRFQASYENLETTTPSILPFIAAAFLIAMVAAVVLKRMREVGRKQLEELDSDEKMVVDMLKQEGGDMLQKDIVEETDYSKAKISGVIGGLEEKDVVSKEKDGRSNRVTLNQKFKD
jgi:uncharacterized membrane protein